MRDLPKVPATLVGLAIGDALGMPFEKPDDRVDPRLAAWGGEYIAGEWKNRTSQNLTGNVPMPYLPPGHWTDDTEMATVLADSLVRCGKYDPEDVARGYLSWARGTPHGMGTATRKAMQKLADEVPWSHSGTTFERADTVGNGTAMRVAPLGVYYSAMPTLSKMVKLDSAITHAHEEAKTAALIVAKLVQWGTITGLLRGGDGADVGEGTLVRTAVNSAIRFAQDGVNPDVAFEKLGRRGNAAQTVSTAVYCAWRNEDDFAAGVIEAVRGGGDADTRGAITGAILGAKLGLARIPQVLVDGLKDSKKLIALDRALALGPRA